MSFRRSVPKNVLFALALAVAAGSVVSSTGCSSSGKSRKGKKSVARQWIDSPSSGKREGNIIKIAPIGLEFEIPDTLYVFKNCDEASHGTSDSPEKGWVAVASCSSAGTTSSDEDLGASSSSDSEMISLNFYLAPKERPVDERAVAFYRNEYEQAGLNIEDLSFNDDYFDKTGIYAKLHIMDESGTNAVREIQQFMFPYGDVVYVVRTEYPYGDSRAIQQDWKSILPYFKVSLTR